MNKQALIYAAKNVTGIIAVYLLSRLLNYDDYIWCLLSVILVTSPEGTDAMTLVIARINANLVGASAGVLMLWMEVPLIIRLCGAAVITISACYLLKLINPMRAALAAAIIVTLHQGTGSFWNIALERVVSVLVGCLIALVVTFIFHRRLSHNTVSKKDSQEG